MRNIQITGKKFKHIETNNVYKYSTSNKLTSCQFLVIFILWWTIGKKLRYIFFLLYKRERPRSFLAREYTMKADGWLRYDRRGGALQDAASACGASSVASPFVFWRLTNSSPSCQDRWRKHDTCRTAHTEMKPLSLTTDRNLQKPFIVILAIAYNRYRAIPISTFNFEVPGCAGRVISGVWCMTWREY